MSLLVDLTNDLRNFDWHELQDFDTVGVWPLAVKLVLVSVCFVACLVAGYLLHIQHLQLRLQQVAGEEQQLRAELEQQAMLAANLRQYQVQTAQMQASFTELLRQLPSVTEVPGLIDDVTSTGESSGLEFASFQLPEEQVQEFYTEIPFHLQAVGDYHDFGAFVSGVAGLDRIVTLHDFSITTRQDALLDMSMLARTYRYQQPDQQVGGEATR